MEDVKLFIPNCSHGDSAFRLVVLLWLCIASSFPCVRFFLIWLRFCFLGVPNGLRLSEATSHVRCLARRRKPTARVFVLPLQRLGHHAGVFDLCGLLVCYFVLCSVPFSPYPD
jgi:hypothetical protein